MDLFVRIQNICKNVPGSLACRSWEEGEWDPPMKQGNEVPNVPHVVTCQSMSSLCGKLVGHFSRLWLAQGGHWIHQELRKCNIQQLRCRAQQCLFRDDDTRDSSQSEGERSHEERVVHYRPGDGFMG